MTTYQLYLLLLGYLTDLRCDNQDVIDALLELYKRAEKEPDKTELYFDDREICKFSCNGECTNMDVHRLINCDLYCDGYSNETCRYRDMEKKTLSEAIVKDIQVRDCLHCKHSKNGKINSTETCHECMWKNQFEKAETEEIQNCAECDNYGTRECYECKRGSLFIKKEE